MLANYEDYKRQILLVLGNKLYYSYNGVVTLTMEGGQTYQIGREEALRIMATPEDHFNDVKSTDVTPNRMTKTLSAFANAEGGELYVGINENTRTNSRDWLGFARIEDANGHVQAFEEFFPLGTDFIYSFMEAENLPGFVLKVEIRKTRDVRRASDGKAYVRRSAQNLPVNDEILVRLRRNKGISSYETEPVNVEKQLITNSVNTLEFMINVVPNSEPEDWLKKQQLVINENPTVAGLVLFAEEPQAVLPKRCGIKLYRYKTDLQEGTRETLDFDPVSIEGNCYIQIKNAVENVVKIIESIQVNTAEGLVHVNYPREALHEIITNAVLHRDYSIADDIHIRIFDNRVEVFSPGTLPGHITPENILKERFSRNAALVRLINKFPDPPNKDVGEGLNTAFDAMRNMKLKPPVVDTKGEYVSIVLRHESLATPQELILEYLEKNPQITNRVARRLTYIGSENKVKRIFQDLIAKEYIELVPGTTRYNAAYRIKSN